MKLQFQLLLAVSFALGCTLGLVWLIYYPGASGPFILDDFSTLSGISRSDGVFTLSALQDFAFGPNGSEPSRWLAKFTFLLNDQYWPAPAHEFKITNILFHEIAGLSLSLFLFRFLPHVLERRVALCVTIAISVIWMLLPIHVASVLYIVQRMTVLMGVFLFLACYLFVISFESRSALKQLAALAGAGFLSFFSVSSKENGAILLVLLPLISLYLSPEKGRWCFPKITRVLFVCGIFLFICLFGLNVYKQLLGYEGRVFSLTERLLVQGEVLFVYVFKSFGFGNITVFNDHYEARIYEGLSSSYFLILWGVHFTLIALAIRYFYRARMFSFGVLWFYITHFIESSFLPLELAFDHRNYVPSVGILICIVGGFLSLHRSLGAQFVGVRFFAAGAACFATTFLLFVNVLYWSDRGVLAEKWARDNPESVRSQFFRVQAYDYAGLEEGALALLYDLKGKVPDPSLELRILKYECDLGIEPTRVDVDELVARNFSSGVLHWTEMLIKDANFECYNLALDSFDSYLEGVLQMPLLKLKGAYLARYADLLGNYFMGKLIYEKAYKYKELAWETQPSIATGLKLVELNILGGNPDLAQEYLDKVLLIADRAVFPVGSYETSIINNFKILLRNQQNQ